MQSHLVFPAPLLLKPTSSLVDSDAAKPLLLKPTSALIESVAVKPLLLKPTFMESARYIGRIKKLTNPKMCVRPLAAGGKTFTLFDDGGLVGGTKQRMLGRLVGEIDAAEFVYAGPNIGIAQLALAYSCGLWGKKATVFLNSHSSSMNSYTEAALLHGASVRHAPRRQGRTLAETQAEARAYAAKRPRRCLLPFGLGSPPGGLFFDALREAIVEALPADIAPPARLWLVAGSGFLFSVLHSIWPSTELMIVQVGRKIWPDQLDGMKAQLFVAPERFAETAIVQPPYPTVPKYDAKVWGFVMAHGRSGDAIWNVASA